MAITKPARRISKVIFYFITSIIIGRMLGSPEMWFDDDCVTRLAMLIYDDGEIGADNFYDLYFYLSVISVFSITTVVYILTINLLRKIRSN